ncbi:MAG: CHAP domain-containing protein [Clostridium sp.]|nr:CHAP domain-containing protein [Clostridium sp.]
MTKTKRAASLFLAAIILISALIPVSAFAASESQIRDKIVSVADGEVGYTDSSTHSKYGKWYGYQGSWCTYFVFWCYNQAGDKLGVTLYGNGVTPSGGNCNSMISWYKNKNRYHTRSSGYTPKTGDMVFFDWSGNGSSQHVGIVDYVSGSTVHTIEGNCSGSVKKREYTTKGSKPYNNVSAIMGYASPDFSSAANGKSETKKEKTTKKKTTTKKAAATKKVTTTKKQENKTTKKKTTTTATQTTKKETTKTTVSTTQTEKIEKLSLQASTYDLKIGDTVKLDYSISPGSAKAVVGYFCDEEDIIQIDAGGDITAIGNGTATVVVCANDEVYSQCDFTVTDAVAEVTTLSDKPARKVVGTVQNQVEGEEDMQAVLGRIGVNIDALTQNKQLYIIPLAIAGATMLICIIICIRKKAKKN